MTIFKLTMVRLFTSKLRLGILFIGPILFISMFVLTISANFNIGIVDEDDSYFSKTLTESLSDRYDVTMINKETITARIAEYQDHYVIVIPEGFERSLENGIGSVNVEVFYQSSTSRTIAVEQDINGIVQRMAAVVSNSVNLESAKSIYANYLSKKFDIMDGEGSNDVKDKFVSAIGFLMQFMLYMSIGTTGILLEDKQNGTYHRTLYAPVKLRRYMFENLLAFMTVGFLQVTVVFGFILLVFDFGSTTYGTDFFAMAYLVMLMFSVVCVALGLFVVNVFKSATAAYSFMAVLTTPLVMIGGCYWDKSLMPDAMNMVGKFLPTTWAMDGIRLIASSGTVNQLLQIIGILILFVACFFALGLFKKVDVAK